MYLSILLLFLFLAPPDNLVTQSGPDKTIILVRHAEKCLGQGSDPALTPSGTERASDLVRTLSDFNIDRIYSTPFKRTLETAAPLATATGLEVTQTPVSKTFLKDLAAEIVSSAESTVVVVGHSNTTPDLINILTGSEMENIDDDVYDILFVVTLREDGTTSKIQFRYGEPSAALVECS